MGIYNPLYTQQLMDKYGVAWFKFDETSGNIFDSKGVAVGTPTGTTIVTGVYGNARSFNGTSDVIIFNSKVLPLGKKSIRFRINISTIPVSISTVIGVSGGSADHGDHILINTSGFISYQSNNGGSQRFAITSTKNICDGQWHDILCTWDGTTTTNAVKLFVDDMVIPNVQGTSTAVETVAQTYNLTLGRNANSANSGTFLNGQFDSLEVYNAVIIPVANKILLSSGSINKSINSLFVKRALSNNFRNVGEEADKAFDDSTTNYWIPKETTTGISGISWIGCEMSADCIMKQVKIYQGSSNLTWLNSLKLQGSNYGSNWVDIQTLSFTVYNAWETVNVASNTSYRYFRLLANSNVSSGGWVVYALQFICDFIPTIISLPSALTEEIYLTYGMDNIVDQSLLTQIGKVADVNMDNTSLDSGKTFTHTFDLAKYKGKKISF